MAILDEVLRWCSFAGTLVVLSFLQIAAHKVGRGMPLRKALLITLAIAFAFKVYALIPIAAAVALLKWHAEVLEFIRRVIAEEPYAGPERRGG